MGQHLMLQSEPGSAPTKVLVWADTILPMSPQPYPHRRQPLSGFGITVFMFRIQRELQVRSVHPRWPNWLAWADYLVLANIVISLVLVVIPLVAVPEPGSVQYSIAAGGCAAAAILQLGYPFAILDHYRIEIGTWRTKEGASRRPNGTRASRSKGTS